MVDITGKRIIVTGSASGLGEAALRAFVRAGAIVAGLDVEEEVGRQIIVAANDEGPGVAYFTTCDVRDREGVFSAIDTAAAQLGGLDAVVHLAGVDRVTPASEISESEWDFVVDVNLKGTFLVNQAAFPHLKEKGGRLINVTSPVAFVAAPNRAHYAAAKAGVASLSRVLASEWGQFGVTVVTISPVAYTPMTDRFRSTLDEEGRARFDASLTSGPLRRTGDPERDIAPVLVFLVSDDAQYITAQIIPIDGGSTPVR
jgi:NAD(P)-dependent dehydrogenase (short-subunit alcohol dehydrogenase family)